MRSGLIPLTCGVQTIPACLPWAPSPSRGSPTYRLESGWARSVAAVACRVVRACILRSDSWSRSCLRSSLLYEVITTVQHRPVSGTLDPPMNANAAAHIMDSLVSNTAGLGCPKERIEVRRLIRRTRRKYCLWRASLETRLKTGTVSSTTKLSDSLSKR